VGKSALFTAGVACVVAGSNLTEVNITASIILIVLGIILIVVYTYLVERQTARKVVSMVLQRIGRRKR